MSCIPVDLKYLYFHPLVPAEARELRFVGLVMIISPIEILSQDLRPDRGGEDLNSE